MFSTIYSLSSFFEDLLEWLHEKRSYQELLWILPSDMINGKHHISNIKDLWFRYQLQIKWTAFSFFFSFPVINMCECFHLLSTNRGSGLLSKWHYDEILISGDLTYADMPMLRNVYSRWQKVQGCWRRDFFFLLRASLGRTSHSR